MIPHQHKKQHPLTKQQLLNQGSFFNCTVRFMPVGCAPLLRCTAGDIPFQAGDTLPSQAAWGQTCEEDEAQAGSHGTRCPLFSMGHMSLGKEAAPCCSHYLYWATRVHKENAVQDNVHHFWIWAVTFCTSLRLFRTSHSCICHTRDEYVQHRHSAQILELCTQLQGSFKATKITPLLFWRNLFFVLSGHP